MSRTDDFLVRVVTYQGVRHGVLKAMSGYMCAVKSLEQGEDNVYYLAPAKLVFKNWVNHETA